MKYSWSLFSKHREAAFGASILAIMLFHYCQNAYDIGVGGFAQSFAEVYNYYIGSIGVEIFLFLSGMGLYFSFRKDHSVIGFYKKRLQRVLLPYLIWGGLYWAVVDILLGEGDFLRDFFFLSFFTDGVTRLWYILLILVMYLLYPFLHRYLYKSERPSFLRFSLLLLAVMLPTAVFAWVDDPSFAIRYGNVEIALTRIPCMLWGSFLGSRIARGERIRRPLLLCLGIPLSILLYEVVYRFAPYSFVYLQYSYPFSRWLNLWYAVGFLFLLCLLFDKLPELRILKTIGSYSLELYLTHVCIRSVFNTILGLRTAYWQNYLICIAISALCSFILRRTTDGFTYAALKRASRAGSGNA